MFGIWKGMHAGTPAGRDDGVFRRRLRRVFRVSPASYWSACMNTREAILRKVQESVDVKQRFFESNAARIDELCRSMAQRFLQGKRLFVMGNGGSACDALHIAVEFKHPIIEKRRALPAEALMSDIATVSAIG